MKRLLIGPLALLLVSCVSINTSIQIANDGSGQISLQYTVSQMVSELGLVDKDWQRLPLPITESDFRRTVGQISGLTLDSFKRTEDAKNITITAKLSFTTVAALNKLYSPGGTGITLTSQNNGVQYRQVLFEGFPDGADQQSKEFANTFFKDYNLKFKLEAPRPIISANIGTISADKRSVQYEISIPALLDVRTPLVWNVSW